MTLWLIQARRSNAKARSNDETRGKSGSARPAKNILAEVQGRHGWPEEEYIQTWELSALEAMLLYMLFTLIDSFSSWSPIM
jgi:hypothetical protein